MFAKWKAELSICPLFAGIAPEELQIMLACLNPEVRRYQKNELVTVEGEKFLGVGVVLAGRAIVTKESVAGNRVILSSLQPGIFSARWWLFPDAKAGRRRSWRSRMRRSFFGP